MSQAVQSGEAARVGMWERHLYAEFALKSADEALLTMSEQPSVLCVPAMTGGVGRDGVRAFYAERFLVQLPTDFVTRPVSRTVTDDRVVDEMVITFTHAVAMDWMLPGVPATGRRVELALVAIIDFERERVARERLYWDQASVLVQLGLLDPRGLPIGGAEVARRVLELAPPR